MSESKLDKFALFMLRNPDVLVFMWFVNTVFTVLNLFNGNISLIKSVGFISVLTVAIGAYLKLEYEERNVTLKQTLIYRFCQLKIKLFGSFNNGDKQ